MTVILIAASLSSMMMVSAESDISAERDILVELNIIDESYFSNLDTVTRGECIVAIMRAIGATDSEIEKIGGDDLIAFADTAVYSYFGCAYLAEIAYGEECVVDYPTSRTAHTLKNTDIFFFPNREATVKEALAFMVRCLEKSDKDKYDIDNILEKAYYYGILNNDDPVIGNGDFLITQNHFCVLLERFLQQERYKYFENNIFRMEGNIDEERSMTYLEMLS